MRFVSEDQRKAVMSQYRRFAGRGVFKGSYRKGDKKAPGLRGFGAGLAGSIVLGMPYGIAKEFLPPKIWAPVKPVLGLATLGAAGAVLTTHAKLNQQGFKSRSKANIYRKTVIGSTFGPVGALYGNITARVENYMRRRR